MNDKEQVIKHLEMIQGVVNRLGHDSFLIKGWSMTILAAGIIFIARSQIQSACIVLTFIIPVIGFWILDGYFLWQERSFRKVYDEVRKQEATDFAMDAKKRKDKPKCNWLASMFSKTLMLFYGIEILFVLFVFGVFFYFQMKLGGIE